MEAKMSKRTKKVTKQIKEQRAQEMPAKLKKIKIRRLDPAEVTWTWSTGIWTGSNYPPGEPT
jgi:hypothetical protein